MKLKKLAQTVKIECKYGAPYNPTFKNSHGYTVRLTYQGRRFTLPFYMGSALTSEPTSYDVLYSLLSDASGIENSRGFSGWCSEYGYDTDSRKAEQTYKLCITYTKKLKNLLGTDYQKFMESELD